MHRKSETCAGSRNVFSRFFPFPHAHARDLACAFRPWSLACCEHTRGSRPSRRPGCRPSLSQAQGTNAQKGADGSGDSAWVGSRTSHDARDGGLVERPEARERRCNAERHKEQGAEEQGGPDEGHEEGAQDDIPPVSLAYNVPAWQRPPPDGPLPFAAAAAAAVTADAAGAAAALVASTARLVWRAVQFGRGGGRGEPEGREAADRTDHCEHDCGRPEAQKADGEGPEVAAVLLGDARACCI